MVKGLPAKWGTCLRTVVLCSCPYSPVCWKDTIAIGLQSGDITILDGITGSQVSILSSHTGAVNSLALSLDCTLFVSGSGDKTVKLWDMQTGGVVKTFHGHTSHVYSVSISVDQKTMASGSTDRTIRLWNIQTGECHRVIMQQKQVTCVSFSPTDPQNLMCVCGSNIEQWDIDGHQFNYTHSGSHVAFSSDGTQFVSYQGESVVVQNSCSREIVTTFHMSSGTNINICCFSPDGRLVAVSPGSTIYIWDITSSNPYLVGTFVGHTNYITSLVFSSSSSLISSSYDHSVKFWQIGPLSADPIVADPEPASLTSAPIRSIALQAKDGIIISSSPDGVVKIWDLLTGFCKASFQTPANGSCQCDVRLIDGMVISVWQVGLKIFIWDVEKGKLLRELGVPQPNYKDIKISSDGSKVFCLGPYIEAWSLWTGEWTADVEHGIMNETSLIIDGSRVWVYSTLMGFRGWDFGISDSPPTRLSHLPSLHLNHTKLWDIHLSRLRDTVTRRVVFQLGGRFIKPVNVQSSGQYLVACYESGEVLILDFSHVFL